MKTLPQFDAEIAACELVLRGLREGRRLVVAAAAAARASAVIADFDADKLTNRQIARKHGMTIAAVVALLWRGGKSRRGAKALRARLQAIPHGASAPNP